MRAAARKDTSAAAAALAAGALATGSAAQDGDSELAVIGRLQLDTTVAEADFAAGSQSWSDSEIRRARIGVDVRDGRVDYRLEVSAEGGDARLEDAWIRLDPRALEITIGQFKTPVSLNQQTSSRFITSMERPAFVETFGFDRRIGVGVSKSAERYTAKAGVFGEIADDDPTPLEQGFAAAARVTFNPLMSDRRIVHLGGSAQYRDAADGAPFAYGARPGIHLADDVLDVPAFADSDAFAGLEAAYIAGPLHVAGELGVLDARGDLESGTFAGGYVEGGLFLTAGDSRGYRDGVFDRTRPARSINDGGVGAWEVRGRVDWLDLSDDAVPGREQLAYTAGTNWYVTDHLRFMGEVSYVDVDGGVLGSGDVRAASLRAAVDW